MDCVLRQTDIPEEWVDCRGVSTVPCLRVMVNLTASNQEAFLHFDEETVLLGTEVGIYVSKFQVSGIHLIAGLDLLQTGYNLTAEEEQTDPGALRHVGRVGFGVVLILLLKTQNNL